jgi:TM2 domain-containing membrane protein YozV
LPEIYTVKKRIAVFIFCLISITSFARTQIDCNTFVKQLSLHPDTISFIPQDSIGANDTIAASTENMRFIAALLAFPAPFGALGLHRIYLGTAPWVPVIYTVTLGGAGVVALADFVYIIFCSDEEFEALKKNQNVFLWYKK